MRRALSLIGLGIVAASQLAAAAPTSEWRELLHIDTARADPNKPFEAFDTASLTLFDINGDGRLEIISLNDNNRAYVLDTEDGDALAEIRTTHPGGESWGARDINPVTITDLRGDGTPCLVIPNSAAYVSAWCYDGRRLFGGWDFEREWEIHADVAEFEPGFAARHPWIRAEDAPGLDGNAFASDVTGDGRPEIFVETDGYPGQLAFTPDGEHVWSTSYWDGNGGAVVRDLDGDGRKEAVFSSDAGVITCYDAASGAIEWKFEAAKNGASPGSVPVVPLVEDLDGDGKLEVVFGARNVADPATAGWIQASHAMWFALRADGSLLWRVSTDWMNPLSYTHPAAVDVDGDNDLDVVAMDWNTVGHKPGNWELTGRGSNLFALDGRTGATLWRQEVPVYWANKDFVVVGNAIILNANQGGADGLAVRALRDGRQLGFYAFDGWEAMRGPVAGDLEGDGTVELVVPVAHPRDGANYRELDVGYREGAIKIIRIGQGDIVFSANFLQTDTLPTGASTFLARILPVPAPLAPLAIAVLVLTAVALRRSGR